MINPELTKEDIKNVFDTLSDCSLPVLGVRLLYSDDTYEWRTTQYPDSGVLLVFRKDRKTNETVMWEQWIDQDNGEVTCLEVEDECVHEVSYYFETKDGSLFVVPKEKQQ